MSPDGTKWIGCRKRSFFLPVRVLSRRFRHLFLLYLRRAFRDSKLKFHGGLAGLSQPAAFEELCHQVRRSEWVVFAKPPFGGPQQVLKYLARYTHRVAISNRRLLSLEDGRVSFEYKDYADGNKTKVMTLEATEFIRRFLLHVLPGGFVRIRQFGFLANRTRSKRLALCRALLDAPASAKMPVIGIDGKLDKPDGRLCPVCKIGHMILLRLVPAAQTEAFPRQDSS